MTQSTSVRRTIAGATWGLLLGLALLLGAAGMYTTLLGVRTELAGAATILSGAITTAYYAGFLLGSAYTVRAVARVGHVRAYSALAAVLCAAVLMIGLTDTPPWWMAFRLLTGFCYAGLYVVAESWLNGLATNEFRGRLLAVYSAIVVGAFGAGQLLIFGLDPNSASSYAIAAVVISLAVVPVAASAQAEAPEVAEPEPMSMRDLARTVPTGMGAILLVGLAHGGVFGLAVIHATREGLSTGQTGAFIAAFQLGGMALNWPISAASDDIDRRVVGVVASLGAAACALALLALPIDGWLTLLVMFGIGGFSNPLYSLAGAYTNDWISVEHLNAAASKLVTLYGVGAMVGPFVASAFMDGLGSSGFAWSIVAMHAMIALFLVYRIRAWHAPLTNKPWVETSLPARAFFIPATIVSVGARRWTKQ